MQADITRCLEVVPAHLWHVAALVLALVPARFSIVPFLFIF